MFKAFTLGVLLILDLALGSIVVIFTQVTCFPWAISVLFLSVMFVNAYRQLSNKGELTLRKTKNGYTLYLHSRNKRAVAEFGLVANKLVLVRQSGFKDSDIVELSSKVNRLLDILINTLER